MTVLIKPPSKPLLGWYLWAPLSLSLSLVRILAKILILINGISWLIWTFVNKIYRVSCRLELFKALMKRESVEKIISRQKLRLIILKCLNPDVIAKPLQK